MRILRLDLQCFGPFTDDALDFGDGHGLHLVVGQNEAGKSSALRALRDMLFGIPLTSPDNFLHNYNALRIGVTLANGAGEPQQFVRRKGSKNTLLAADGKTPADEDELARRLGSIGPTMFDLLFGLSHEQLVAGGKAIIEGGGELGSMLFSAGSGIADLHAVQKTLEDETAKIFSPQASKPTLNALLSQVKAAKEQIKAAQLPGTQYETHRNALAAANEELTKLAAEHQTASKRLTQLQRARDALPILAERRLVSERCAAMQDVRPLAPDFAARRRQAEEQSISARSAESMARSRLAELERERAGLTFSAELAAQHPHVNALREQLGSHRKAQRDLPGLIAERAEVLKSATVLLAALRPGLALDRAGELRLTPAQQTSIQSLSKTYSSLIAAKARAESLIRQAREALGEVESQIAALPTPRDCRLLQATVERWKRASDLDAELAEAQAEQSRLAQQATAELKRLGLWRGTIDELEAAALPSDEAIESFEVKFADLDRRLARAEEARAAREQRQADIARQLDQLQLAGEVPVEADLIAARTVRDDLWRRVIGAWKNGAADDDLAAAFENANARCDELADRLRREAGRVAERVKLVADQRAGEAEAVKAADSLQQLSDERQAAQAEWLGLWQPSGIAPRAPREMRSWQLKAAALAQQAQSLRRQATAAGLLAKQRGIARHELGAAMQAVGESRFDAEAPLATLLLAAESVVECEASLAGQRHELVAQRKSLEKQLAAGAREQEEASAGLADWQVRWAAAVAPLGLAADAAPEQADAALRQAAELFQKLDRAESLRAERIEGISRDTAAFEQSLRSLAARVAPDLVDAPLEKAAETLLDRIAASAAGQQSLARVNKQIEKHQAELNTARRQSDEAGQRLAALCREAGCADPDELHAVEQRAAEAAAVRERLDGLERQLAHLAGSQSLEAFAVEVGGQDTDALPGQIALLTREIAELDQRRLALSQTVGREQEILSGMDGGDAAADAVQRLHLLLAQVESDAERYVRLRLACRVLRDGLERYRRRHQGPILERASELFRRLTLGSFAGLQVDVSDKGQAILVGLRADSRRLVRVEGMSEGTCDQLYLALRLAGLEAYARRAEPLPLVLDDLLIHFDNARAAAALQVICELSSQLQVILFTHHEHLLELAAENLAEGGYQVHWLRQPVGWVANPSAP